MADFPDSIFTNLFTQDYRKRLIMLRRKEKMAELTRHLTNASVLKAMVKSGNPTKMGYALYLRIIKLEIAAEEIRAEMSIMH